MEANNAAALVRQSPYVAFENIGRSTSGVLEGIYNADVDGGFSDYTGQQVTLTPGADNSDVFFYGELPDISSEKAGESYNTVRAELTFSADKIVTGYPEYAEKNQSVIVVYLGDSAIIEALEVGQRYFLRVWYDFGGPNGPNWETARQNMSLKSLTESGSWFIEVAANEELDFSDPAYAELKKEIETVRENQHSMFVITTADLSAEPLTQESIRWYYLTDGRWINHEDDLNANRVCVVHAEFAEMRGLSVGDKNTLNFRRLNNFPAYITDGDDKENWQSFPTYEDTFEIVGLISQAKFQATFEFNYMYIPVSTIPPESLYSIQA